MKNNNKKNNVRLITSEQLKGSGYITHDGLVPRLNASLNMKPFPAIALRGKAGTGKTFLVECLARMLKAKLIRWQAFRGANEADLFYAIFPSPSSPSGVKMEEGVLVKACKESQAHLTILLLDEWDKIRESADATLLTFLQSGQIFVEGVRTQANLSNLIVCLGMNNERPYGEFLVRRLSFFEFHALPVETVRKALELTHADHLQLEPAVRLYEMSLQAELEKPATIQELRQLLDACTILGEHADWDELVYQFVTKDLDAHQLLKSYSHHYTPILPKQEDQDEWDYEKLESQQEIQAEEHEERIPKVPVFKLKQIQPPQGVEVEIDESEEVGGVFYRKMLPSLLISNPEVVNITDNVNNMGDTKIIDDKIIVIPPLTFTEGSWELMNNAKDGYLFQLSFSESPIEDVLSEINDAEDIKTFTRYLVKHFTFFTLTSVSLDQVLFTNETYLIDVSINFKNKIIEIGGKRRVDDSKIFTSLKNTFLKSRDEYNATFHGFAFPKSKVKESKEVIDSKLSEDTEKVLTFIATEQHSLVSKLASHVDSSYDSEKKIVMQLLKHQKVLRVLTEACKEKKMTIQIMRCVQRMFEKTGRRLSLIHVSEYMTRGFENELLTNAFNMIMRRIAEVKQIEDQHEIRLKTKKTIEESK